MKSTSVTRCKSLGYAFEQISDPSKVKAVPIDKHELFYDNDFYSSFVGCGGALVGESGNFTSPNYPSNYPSIAECVWTITVPSGNIYINFTDFVMESHSRCAFDYVEVR